MKTLVRHFQGPVELIKQRGARAWLKGAHYARRLRDPADPLAPTPSVPPDSLPKRPYSS